MQRSSTSNGTILPDETTGTFRRLCLRSSRANLSTNNFNKLWWIPPMKTSSKTKFKVFLQSLHIFHTFPSVYERLEVHWKNAATPVVTYIPVGDWDALSLATYLERAIFAVSGSLVSIDFDFQTLMYTFSPPLEITYTTANRLLGLSSKTPGVVATSDVPVNFINVQSINVHLSWTSNNIPQTNYLTTIPVDVEYGDLITYQDTSSHPGLLMDFDVSNITVELKDQDANPLSRYGSHVSAYPEWVLVLSLEPFE